MSSTKGRGKSSLWGGGINSITHCLVMFQLVEMREKLLPYVPVPGSLSTAAIAQQVPTPRHCSYLNTLFNCVHGVFQ